MYSLEDLVINETVKVKMNTGAAGAPVIDERKNMILKEVLLQCLLIK